MCHNLLDDRMHPGRGMSALLCELCSILVVQRPGDLADHLIVHAILADIAERLENSACLRPSPDQCLRRGIAELDHLPTDCFYPYDLQVLSTLAQDAVFPASEMQWLAKERKFAILLNRFRWEDQPLAEARGRAVERPQNRSSTVMAPTTE